MRLVIVGLIAVVIFMVASCQSEDSIEFKRYYSSGALVYQTHCQNCHGANGEGLSSLMPPLTDSLYLKANKSQLACYVKAGLTGPIKVKSRTYDDKMPPADLSPIEIAQVLTYIRNSFGNKLNTINEQMIQADLGKCK